MAARAILDSRQRWKLVDQTQRNEFTATLKKLGRSADNGSLQEALKWDETTYSAVKEDQVRAGVVTAGHGRGGSIALTERAPQVEMTLEQLIDQDVPATPPKRAKSNGNGGDLGFEAELFKSADKLRGNMEPSDYKHVSLGLIFLKHISDSFEAKRAELLPEHETVRKGTKVKPSEDRDEYAANNVFWVPTTARWSHLQANARQSSIGKMIDEAMIAIEKDNENLKGVLPKE